MTKRQFLKTSGALMADGVMSGLLADERNSGKHTNWAGNYQYHSQHVYEPKSVQEVSEVVKRCNKLRALGTRHSFNGIADSTDSQISLKNLNQMELNRKGHTVVVGAGVPYGKLAPYLT